MCFFFQSVFWSTLYYEPISFGNDVLVTVISCFFLFVLWMCYYIYKIDIKKSSIRFFEIIEFLIITLFAAFFSFSIASLFSSIQFLSGYLFSISFWGLLLTVFPIYMVRKRLEDKVDIKFSRDKCPIYRFIDRKPIFNLTKDGRSKIVSIFCIFIFIFVIAFLFITPKVTVSEKEIKSLYIDGDGFTLTDEINKSVIYQEITYHVYIDNWGMLRWLPIESKEMDPNVTGYNTYPPKLTIPIKIKGYEYSNSPLESIDKKVVVLFNSTSNTTLKELNMSGWERTQLLNFSINEPDIVRNGKNILMTLNINYSLDVPLEMWNIELRNPLNNRGEIENCNLSFSGSGFDYKYQRNFSVIGKCVNDLCDVNSGNYGGLNMELNRVNGLKIIVAYIESKMYFNTTLNYSC